jgi:hypothetical protein
MNEGYTFLAPRLAFLNDQENYGFLTEGPAVADTGNCKLLVVAVAMETSVPMTNGYRFSLLWVTRPAVKRSRRSYC